MDHSQIESDLYVIDIKQRNPSSGEEHENYFAFVADTQEQIHTGIVALNRFYKSTDLANSLIPKFSAKSFLSFDVTTRLQIKLEVLKTQYHGHNEGEPCEWCEWYRSIRATWRIAFCDMDKFFADLDTVYKKKVAEKTQSNMPDPTDWRPFVEVRGKWHRTDAQLTRLIVSEDIRTDKKGKGRRLNPADVLRVEKAHPELLQAPSPEITKKSATVETTKPKRRYRCRGCSDELDKPCCKKCVPSPGYDIIPTP